MLHRLLTAFFGSERVQVQGPIEVQIADQKWTLPEPDLVVLKEDKPDFKTRYVTGSELLLLIEVADTPCSSISPSSATSTRALKSANTGWST